MTLLDKQIKAVQEAKEQCVREALFDVRHDWNSEKCPLCKCFMCHRCPLIYWLGKDCMAISRNLTRSEKHSNSQNLACFLYSLELYLREQEKGLTKRSGLGII